MTATAIDPTTRKWIKTPNDEKAASEGFYFCEESAQHFVDFVGELRHTKGRWAGKPVTLLPWQDRELRRVFGWMRPDGTRRHRFVYWEIPKKNGKSTICSAVALYLLCGDGEPGAEVYCAASDKDQAAIVFDAMTEMAERCPLVHPYLQYRKTQGEVVLPGEDGDSVAKVLSGDAKRVEGKNIHGLVFDELHAQRNEKLFESLRYGGASREQPLLFFITTAGDDKTSVCYETRQLCQKVEQGLSPKLDMCSFITGVEDDEDWTTEESWKKANPSMGETKSLEDMREMYQEAIDAPRKIPAFKRYQLNMWGAAASAFLQSTKWDACAVDGLAESLRGKRCYGGLDLASKNDLAAFALVFPDENAVLVWHWCNEAAVDKRSRVDHVPYNLWATQGLITICPGETNDYAAIRAKIKELSKVYSIQEIAFDPHDATETATALDAAGFEVVEVRQSTLNMHGPMTKLEELVASGDLKHDGNDLLAWQATNLVAEEDSQGHLRPDKKRSSEKIDGMVATLIGMARALRHADTVSVYETRGPLAI